MSTLAAPRPMSSLTGTRSLLRLGLRRDRIMIPVWILALLSSLFSTLGGYRGLYKTAAERQHFADGANGNSSTLAFYGPLHDPSLGGMTAWRMGALGAAFVGVMSVLLVIRHTRAEEEEGRLELVGAGVVGRRAALTAALLVAVLAALALGVLVMLGLASEGVAGAVSTGVGWAAAGILFAAVGAVAAQVTENARAARGIGVGVIAAAYLLRAAGDATEGAGWLTWLSPIGWIEQIRPYGGDRLWAALLPLAAAALLIAAAYALIEHRDLGAGLLAPRPGPAEAAPGLRSPLALAWRLQSGSLYGWACGFLVYGLVVGGIAKGIGDLVGGNSGTNDLITKMGGQSGLVDAFLVTCIGLMSAMASLYGVQAALRLRTEEGLQRVEPLLATAVGRVRWVAGHLLIALAGTVVMLLVSGLSIGLTYGASVGDLGGKVPELLGAVLVQTPAAWVAVGIGIALFGLAPRFSPAAWAVVAGFLLLGQLGPVLDLGQAVMDLSPFTHVPKLPGGTMDATPLIVLTAIVAALIAAGLYGIRRRDIAT
ncbi:MULTISPECIES: ABC transporter permease [Thermomonosporaceae]|uniref:ABC transporter permease n=1 Tax=Thermomonosporaceae TaxID=2012 RepID=UPI00255B1C1C|nr:MULTISPECIES: ABC transporter permease [Thermomonosporaceae]MDL4770638.1 ABC transporter permease [Actinomadura xylanilytica]